MSPMPPEDDRDQVPHTVLLMINGWQATLMLGLVTLVFGVIVTAHPNGSLHVLVVLAGIAVIVSGVFHLIRTFDPQARHRLWVGVCGLVFVALGLVLIRSLHLSMAAIALLVGLGWIVQGAAALMSAFSRPREGGVWWVVFGIVSLIAGTVVVAVPETSVAELAALVGVWLVVIGLLEVVAGLVLQQRASPDDSGA